MLKVSASVVPEKMVLGQSSIITCNFLMALLYLGFVYLADYDP